MKLSLKFHILPSESPIFFFLRNFISNSTKQPPLRLSLEQPLVPGQINGEEEQWKEGWTGGLGTGGEDNKFCFIGKD